MNKQKQVRGFVQKQKQLIAEATEQTDKDYLVVMWLGFINGLRLTNAITWCDYLELEREIEDYASGVEAA